MEPLVTSPLLDMDRISKSYPGVQALDGVSLRLHAHEILALVGENGAGKSTLMKVLSGAVQADAGEIRLLGQTVQIADPRHARDLGIAMIHQELALVPQFSAVQNLFMGRELTRGRGILDWNRARAEAARILAGFNLTIDVDRPVSRYPIAVRQMIEIARAVSSGARIVIMDEPTSSLTARESDELFRVARALREQGVGIIYISHHLEELFHLCDRAAVLRDGRLVGTVDIASASRDQLVRMMVGREPSEFAKRAHAELGEERLYIEGMRRSGVLSDVSLSVRRGEVLGLAGLVGAGRSELARAIIGADPIDGGRVLLDGREVRIRSPEDAAKAGIAYVPEDRKAQGLILGMPIEANLTLPILPKLAPRGWLSRRRRRETAQRLATEVQMRPPDVRRLASQLSGGNQQKVVLGKWLGDNASVFIFDEPTRGIDVGAKVEIYALIDRLAQSGAAILLISSELPEILGLSDRIAVMRQGRIVDQCLRAEATEERIVQAAMAG
jgi:ABC-type sugar transport system ATPase subunit